VLIGFPTEDLSRPQSRLEQHLDRWIAQRWTPFDGPVWRSGGPTWMEPEVLLMMWDYQLMREQTQ